jgi:hypothetical protein
MGCPRALAASSDGTQDAIRCLRSVRVMLSSTMSRTPTLSRHFDGSSVDIFHAYRFGGMYHIYVRTVDRRTVSKIIFRSGDPVAIATRTRYQYWLTARLLLVCRYYALFVPTSRHMRMAIVRLTCQRARWRCQARQAPGHRIQQTSRRIMRAHDASTVAWDLTKAAVGGRLPTPWWLGIMAPGAPPVLPQASPFATNQMLQTRRNRLLVASAARWRCNARTPRPPIHYRQLDLPMSQL